MVVCPACGEENPERARFCLACGNALTAARGAGEERKVVSVLFVDLAGFTARSGRLDPEDVQALLRPYHARLRQEIEVFGGTVEKFIGDAIMAVFGAPVTHEDDAERAVRAALRILDAIDELNQAQPGLELSVRAAVNTGEVVVALAARPDEGVGMVAGDVVNIASRLQEAAAVGTVVVGELTHRTTREAIEYAELGVVSLKGKPEPVHVWKAIAARRRGAASERTAQATFVGRDHELALLNETLARAVRASSIQLVTLAGEPGIGKSRLVDEFHAACDRAEVTTRWRQGRCLPYGDGVTFWALGEIIKADAGILESDRPAEALGKIEQAVAAVTRDPAERSWLVQTLAPLVGSGSALMAAGVERQQAFTGWRRYLEALAAGAPLVLLFEDLHWADPALVDFVEHLVEWSSGVPLLVICTARPEFYEQHPSWGGGKRNSSTIALAPLSDEVAAGLLASLLPSTTLPWEVQATILARAGGNPLFTEEFARIAAEGSLEETRLPETIHSLIAARLDTLAPALKGLAQDAAVVGEVFWPSAVAFMQGVDESVLIDGLHQLAVKEFVRRVRDSSVKGTAEYAFWHILVRDVAYAEIPRAARAAKHRAVASWIEHLAAGRVTDHAELLAHHYERALDLTRASGDADQATALEAPTRRFLVMAGDRAMGLDVRRAETYYRRAMELATPSDPERVVVLSKLADAAQESGRLREAVSGYEQVIAESRQHGQRIETARAKMSLALALWRIGDTERHRHLLGDAIALLEQEPPGPDLARAYVRMARDCCLSGRDVEGLGWADRAMPLAKEFDLNAEIVRLLQFRGQMRCFSGDSGGFADLREALRCGLERGLGFETATSYLNLGDVVARLETPAEALALYRQSIEFSELRGLAHNTMWSRAEAVRVLFELGRWDEVLGLADELLDWERGIDPSGGTQIAVMASVPKARVLCLRGEIGDAVALADRFLGRARKIGDVQVLPPALITAALIERARNRMSSAVSLVEEFAEATRVRPVMRAPELPDAVRCCLAADALDLAESLLADVPDTPPRSQLALLTCRAVIAEARGNVDDAAGLHADAAGRWAELEMPVEYGLALTGQGRCVLTLGRSDDAVLCFESARTAFTGLQAGPLVAEVDALRVRAAVL